MVNTLKQGEHMNMTFEERMNILRQFPVPEKAPEKTKLEIYMDRPDELQELFDFDRTEMTYILSGTISSNPPSLNSHIVKVLMTEDVVYMQFIQRYYFDKDYVFAQTVFKERVLKNHQKLTDAGFPVARIENRWGLFSKTIADTVDDRRRIVRR